MSRFYNLARMTSTTTGTGTLTLGSAVSGCLSFADAGVQDGDVVHYGISDGADSEVGIGTYTAAGTTLARTTVESSTNSGNKITCSGSEQVFITPLASDLEPLETIIGGVRHRHLWIGNWQPTLTNGCGAKAQLETSTNKNVYDYLPFDSSTAENAYANIVMPENYKAYPIYAKVYWTHPATTTNFGVAWTVGAIAMYQGDVVGDLDFYTPVAATVTDTGGTTYNLYTTALTSAIAPAGADEDSSSSILLHLEITRTVSNGSDNMAVDAYLLGAMIFYPVDVP